MKGISLEITTVRSEPECEGRFVGTHKGWLKPFLIRCFLRKLSKICHKRTIVADSKYGGQLKLSDHTVLNESSTTCITCYKGRVYHKLAKRVTVIKCSLMLLQRIILSN